MTHSDERESPGQASQGFHKSTTATGSSLPTIPERVDRFLHDALTEVFLTAERAWWLRRAEDFERAKPRVGDNFGRLTRDQVREQWHRLDELARACRARAHVSPVDDIREDVRNVLREAS